jgi:nicotinamidase/pyrazinamidase
MEARAALVIVDVQNDFCPGGSLAVAGGDQVAAAFNRYIQLFTERQAPIFATRDWHPAKTRHFKIYGGIWPAHCVKDSPGAAFHPALKLGPATVVVSKGAAVDADSYSGFDGVDQAGANLASLLRQHNVDTLYVGGLATDYCVKQTVLDGLKQGFVVYLLKDAIRGVDLRPGDSQRAIDAMVDAGARLVNRFAELEL